MNWKWHLGLGFILQTSFMAMTNNIFRWIDNRGIEFYAMVFLILFVSPLIPDIDYIHAKISQIILFIGCMLGVFGLIGYYLFDLDVIYLIFGFLIMAGTFVIATISRHRGFTHSLAFILIMGAAMFYFVRSIELSLLLMVGIWTHLLGDSIPLKLV